MSDTIKIVRKPPPHRLFEAVKNVSSKTEGVYRICRTVKSSLDIPLLVTAHGPLLALQGRLKRLTGIYSALQIIFSIEEFVVPGKNGKTVIQTYQENGEWAKIASRVCLLFYSFLAPLRFLHFAKVVDLSKISQFTIGNIPLFSLIIKLALLGYAVFGLIGDVVRLGRYARQLNGTEGKKGIRQNLTKWESLGKKIQKDSQHVKEKLRAKYQKKLSRVQNPSPKYVEKIGRYLKAINGDHIKTLCEYQVEKWKGKKATCKKDKFKTYFSLIGYSIKIALSAIWFVGVAIAGLGVFSIFGFGLAFAIVELCSNSFGLAKFLVRHAESPKLPKLEV